MSAPRQHSPHLLPLEMVPGYTNVRQVVKWLAEFNAWSSKRALEKQKDLVLLKAFEGGDINAAWFPLPNDIMQVRLERQDLLPVPIHFAFPLVKMEDWIGWAKDMLIDNGFVEILRAARILKLVALCQTLQISSHMECLCHLVRRSTAYSTLAKGVHGTDGPEESDEEKCQCFFSLWRGECNIDFLTWMRYFQNGKGKDSPYVRVAFLMSWLIKFVLRGFLNHEIMAKCISLAIRLAEGSQVCLSLLQMFVWERFHQYCPGHVTSGKALKEYPMAKCGYTSGTTPLTYSWIGKRKVKRLVVLEVDCLLDDYDDFNFHECKSMSGMFTLPEVSFFDKMLPTMPRNQIVNFNVRDLSHLEMQFGYDQDIPPAPSSDKIDWNRAMRPYIDEATTTMWSEGAVTLRFFSTARMSTMPLLMLEYCGALLKKFEAFIQSLLEGFLMREDNGQWVPVYLAIPSMAEEEYDQGVVSYGTPNMAKKSTTTKTQPEGTILKSCPISKLTPFRASNFELVLGGFILKRHASIAITEKGVEKGKTKATIGINEEKEKVVTEEISSDSNDSSSDKSNDQDASFENENDVGDVVKKSISNKSKVDINKPTMSLVKKAVGPNEIKHSEQPSSIPSQVWACHLLDTFPNLTTRSKAKKVVVEDIFAILYVAMRQMEVTLFTEINEDFFYLCRDAIDDTESINFEVNVIRTHLSNLAKAYLKKIEFNMTKELVLKLEEGSVTAKAHLESLNQEKEHLSSNGATELCQAFMEATKAYGDELGPFLP
ncbi:hypothetical protein SLEP1_g26253 [Rubroshorea leprosula]|uniref:Aminotransferase-like plant mobile domain-containing protein n=1 Tax=Rubroshorea leprosula TaxID=152421 RepID=A0AAV5JVR3_9ROSI|nr:hypothetical protein SLEP1_g26253 [Rubroshorea leprosula]